jgi:putative ABC transport system permease protein
MTRLYRWLLRLFPPEFRRRYGADMADVFSDHWRTARRAGPRATVRFLAETIADIWVHAIALRRREIQLPGRRQGSVMRTLWLDGRFAIRSFRQRVGLTTVALLTIALGIGANTAIFSVVRPLLLDRLPFPEPDRIVSVYEFLTRDPDSMTVASPMNFDAWEKQRDVFAAIAGFSGRSMTLSGTAEARRIDAVMTTSGLFDVFGVRPAVGRTFSEAEAAADEKVVVLSDALWRSVFGGDPAVLTSGIRLNREQWRVIGIMPPGFEMPGSADAWVPLALTPEVRTNRNTRFLQVAARLAPGVSMEMATTAVAASMARLAAAYPKFNQNYSARAAGWREMGVGHVREGLWMLQGIAIAVWLIACANLANLLLALTAGRAREFAIRAAVGAGRARLVRQILTEGVLLSFAGGFAGILLAIWATPAIATLAPRLPQAERLAVGMPDVFMALSMSVLTGVVVSVLPAIFATHAAPRLVTARTETGSRGQRSTRALLVGVQVAIAVVLLAGAALLARSFLRLTAQPIGFAPGQVMTAQLSLPRTVYDTEEKRRQLFASVVDALEREPGVVSVTASNALPFTWYEWMEEFVIVSRSDAPHLTASYRVVTPSYFETMQVPVVRGRGFSASDTSAGPRVAVVNETFAKRYGASGDVSGLTLALADDRVPIAIVGVVGDTRHRSFERPPQAEVFLPLSQSGPGDMTIAVRTARRAADAVPALQRVLRAIDPELPMADTKTLQSWVGEAVTDRRFYLVLLGVFAGTAVVLSVVGIYGVTSYVMRLRTREMAIRIAIGATTHGVERLAVRQGMTPVLVGLAAGIGVALFATRLLADQLFQIQARDPSTLIATSAVFVVVAAAACWMPARRTVRGAAYGVLQGDV